MVGTPSRKAVELMLEMPEGLELPARFARMEILVWELNEDRLLLDPFWSNIGRRVQETPPGLAGEIHGPVKRMHSASEMRAVIPCDPLDIVRVAMEMEIDGREWTGEALIQSIKPGEETMIVIRAKGSGASGSGADLWEAALGLLGNVLPK